MWQHLKQIQQTAFQPIYETGSNVQSSDEHETIDNNFRIHSFTPGLSKEKPYSGGKTNNENTSSSKKIRTTDLPFESNTSQDKEVTNLLNENKKLKAQIESLQKSNEKNTGSNKKSIGYNDDFSRELSSENHSLIIKNDVQTLELLILKFRDNLLRLQTDKSRTDEYCDKYQDLVDQLDTWIQNTLKQQQKTKSQSQMNSQMSSSTNDPELISVKEIKLLEKIGAGANSVVHRGLFHGEEVAIKKIYRKGINAGDLEKLFWKEVGIMKRMRHPKIVRMNISIQPKVLFMGTCVSDDYFYIITEYMPRKSLDIVLKDQATIIDSKRKIKMALDIAKALCFLHNFVPPILHRDLKAANCLCDDSFNVKIADFGLAKLLDNNLNTTSIATVKYMAPEFISKQIFTAKSDIFSFGMILWEIWTRKEAFENFNPPQAIYAIANNRRPDFPKSFPSEIKKIIESCWHQDPEKRPEFNIILTKLQDAYTIVEQSQFCLQGSPFFQSDLYVPQLSAYNSLRQYI